MTFMSAFALLCVVLSCINAQEADKFVFPDEENVQADDALYQPQNVIEKFSFPDRVPMGSYSGEKTYQGGVKTFMNREKYGSGGMMGASHEVRDLSNMGGCSTKLTAPFNAAMKCTSTSSSTMCRFTCRTGYKFPTGDISFYLTCSNNQWVVKDSQSSTIPHACEPICLPSCQNNGICIAPGQCQCPDNFMGPTCQNEKKFCLQDSPLPANSKRSCSPTACTITCMKGYTFPDGSTATNIICKDGKWLPTRPELAIIPDCKAICSPPCQNGGHCLSLNVCQCPPNFRGPQCQYSVEVCSPKKLNFNGAYNCSGSGNSLQCSITCPRGIDFDYLPAKLYSCNYAEGKFLPQPIPLCKIPEGMQIIPGHSSSNTYYKASNATISSKGSKKKIVYDVKANDDDEDEWEEEIITKTEIKTKKKKKAKSSSKYTEVEGSDEQTEQMPGVYEMYLSQQLDVIYRIPKPAVCMAWNGNKVKTFDGVIYEADIHCSHTLVQDRLDGSFSIILRSCPYDSHEPCPHAIDVFIQNEHYTFENDGNYVKVFTPKKVLSIPIQIAGLRVTRAGDTIRIELESIQTTILWDTNKFVTLEVTPSLWNRTMGLCGTMDKDITNDFQSKINVVHKMPQTFVDSWKATSLDKNPTKCTATGNNVDVPEPSSEELGNAELICNKLLQNTKLTNCFKMFDMKSLLRSCMNDYTNCNSYNKNKDICSCKGIAVLAKDCQFQGVMLDQGWRDLTVCPLNCPNGKIYKSCGPQFEPTCGSTVTDTVLTCQEGCFCPQGTILNNGTCIAPETCPCTLHNKNFKPGSKVRRDCNICTCQSGIWKCSTETCGARCSAIGDPHYTTFDGKRYDFMGTCSYYLIKTDDLSIETENVACPGSISADISPAYAVSDMPSCTKSVTINFQDMSIKLKLGKIVTVDGVEIKKFPKGLINGLVKIREASSTFILVDFQGGLKIWWDGFSRVHVDAPATYRGVTKGLCGTFNSNQQDDFLTPEGDIETSVEPFADKWRVQDSCPMLGDSVTPPHPCRVNIENKVLAEEICNKIRIEAFEECHWLADPEPFYEDCLYDVCASKNDKTVACPILASYATDCSRQGYIANWRDAVPECAVKCPVGQIYEQCGGACSRTCSDIQSESECKLNCVEGCRCPPHQVLDDANECVPRKMCECSYKGLTFKPNYKEVRPGNKFLQLCTCSEAKWNCTEARDGDAERYPPAGDLRSKCSAGKNEEFTTCEPVHPVTCKNMHSPVAQTSPAECKPGCVCKSGYVLDVISKACVRPENCSCHHGGKSYKEGEKITEDCNTCVCASGNWNCPNKKCPQTCTSWGDSHFETFDGKDFDFQGVCSYVLSKGKLSDGDGFSVTIQNILCGTLGVTCSRSVQISVMSAENTETVVLSSEMSKPSIKTSIQNKSGQPQPGKLQKILIHKSGIFVVLEIPSLDVQIKWDRGTRVYVKLDDRWMNKVKGLCGNYNGDAKDDLSTPSSGIETSPVIFGHSWKLEDTCKMPTELIDACQEHPHREAWAQSKCGILKTPIFSPCHSVVPVDKYMKRCIFDTCACDKGGDCECLCTAIAAYAHACSMRGVPIRWRTPELCPMQCDPTCSTYKPCISSCPVETCDNFLDETKIQKLCTKDKCVEGCEIKKCPDGFIYSNDSFAECIPKATCKPICQEKNGIVYYESDITETDDCHTCRCSRGKEICTGIPCPVTDPKELFTTPMQPWALVTSPPVPSTTPKSLWNGTSIRTSTTTPFIFIQQTTTGKPFEMIQSTSTNKPLFVAPPLPITSSTLRPYSTTTTGRPMQTETLSCVSGWTVWINQDKFDNKTAPSYTKTKTIPKKFKNGDNEPLPSYFILKNLNGNAYCAPEFIKNIECRTVGTNMLPKATGQDVECSLDRGLICYGDCYDFETRVFCNCGGAPQKLSTPKYTSPTTVKLLEEVIMQTTKKPWFTLGSEVCDPGVPHVEFPGDCHKFRHCQPNVNNSYTYAIKTCGDTMMYNPNSMICDWPASVISIKPECERPELAETLEITDSDEKESVIIERCKDGYVWDSCAIPCGKSCHYYHKVLIRDGECKKDDTRTCLGKCVPKRLMECNVYKILRDRETCVEINDCTCMSKTGSIVKPGEIVEEFECGRCQCIDNKYVCTISRCNDIAMPFIGPSRNQTRGGVPPIVITASTLTPPTKCDPSQLIHMIDGDHKLPDEAFSASSILGSYFQPHFSRLNSKANDISSGSWSPEINDQMQFLQVKFSNVVPLYGVIIRGSPMLDQYVTSFKIFHSFDEINFHFLADETDSPQIFSGSVDSKKPVQSLFKIPIEAKVIRVYPLTWHSSIAIRLELLGCLPQGTITTFKPIAISTTTAKPKLIIPTTVKPIQITTQFPKTTIHFEEEVIPVCIDDMGVENGQLSPSQVQTSSFRTFPKHKRNARPIDYLKLSAPKGWRPFIDSPNEYIVFDFLEPRNLTGVKTKGGSTGWVKAYNVLYSPDKFVWNRIYQEEGNEKLFLANFDSITPKINYFTHPINTRYLKIVPIKWHETMEMKIEPLGCFVPYKKIQIVPTTTLSPVIVKILDDCDVCEGIKEIPKIYENTCPCLPPLSWNGNECVKTEQCPCMVGHMPYDIGVQYETEDCSECTCVLGGISQCKPKKCPPCKTGLRRAKTNDCSCRCETCPPGETLCPTSGGCISDEKWCDGVTDCPDDEINCIKIDVPHFARTIEEKLTIKKTCPTPECPTGFTMKVSNHKQKLSQMFQTGVKGGTSKSYSKSYQSTGSAFTLDTPKTAFDVSESEEECLQFVCIPEKPKIDWSEEDKQYVIRCPSEVCPKAYQVVREEFPKPNQCSKFTCEPIPQKDAICNVTGRIINTFDGTEIKFDICSHILARDIVKEKWAVILRKNCSAGNYICSKELEVVDNVSKLSLVVLPNLNIRVGGYTYEVQQLSKSPLKSSFVISKNGDNLLLISQLHGFWIKYGLNGDIKIGVTDKFAATVDGLCGYFNNDKKDDKRMPSGQLAQSTLEFGNSWNLKDVPEENCKPHACPKHLQDIAFEMCNSVRHETFTACGRVVNIDSFLSKCLESTCDCLQKSDSSKTTDAATIKKNPIAKVCKCATLQNFVVECLAADENIQLDTWRSIHNCEATCPQPFVHKDCYRRLCEPVCTSFRNKKCQHAPGTCFSGCYCPEGTIRRGDTCIPLSECRDCVCDGFGRSQYISYDRANFTFDGNCTYLLSRDLTLDNVPTFQVYATIGPCAANKTLIGKTSSCTQAFHIIHGSQVIHIQRGPYNKFETIVNGIKVIKLPYKDRSLRIIEQQPGELKAILLESKVEITTLLEDMSFSIRVPSLKFGSKMEGLCGDCNGDATDDIKLNPKKTTIISGTEPTIKEFANSWLADEPKLGKNEELCHTDDEAKCQPLSPDLDPCFKIMDESIFGQCHLLVDPIMYVSACQKDICASGPTQKGACESLAAYARECSRNGLCIDWRRNDFCPVKCQYPLAYSACGCPENCETIKSRPLLGVKSAKVNVCHVQKTEGCYCPSGKILHTGKCVYERECNACDDLGHITGDVWYPDKCTECTCGNNTKITCSKTQCSSVETVCSVGLVPLEVINNDACCKKFVCVPRPADIIKKICPDPVLPTCGLHQIKKAERDPYGCITYVCECQPKAMCRPLDPKPKIMKDGQKYTIDNTTCCPSSKIICDKSLCSPQLKYCVKEFYESKKVLGQPDDCCEEYICEPPKDKCIIDIKNKKYLKNLNEKWPTDDPCSTEMCIYGLGGQLMIHEEIQKCDEKCDLDQELQAIKGKCCGKCVKTKCIEGTNYYLPGDTWYNNSTCTTFTCTKKGDEIFITSQHETCPAIDCPESLQYKRGCCTFCNPPIIAQKNCVAQVYPDIITVGLIRDIHPVYGKCKNKLPIRGFTECNGACNSGTKFNQQTFKQDNRCECCSIGQTRDLEVPLFCENGSSMKKLISVPLTCKCNPCSDQFSSKVPIV